MGKNLKIFLLAILTSSGFFMGLNAQLIIPKDDPNYEPISTKSDEFTGTSLNLSKWETLPAWTTYGIYSYGWYMGANTTPINVVVSGGRLKLRLTKSGSTYYVGQIESQEPNYSFGYFEISAKVDTPGYYNQSGQPILSGIWPTFWLYNLRTNCDCFHDEIDIMDNLYGHLDNQPGITASEDTKVIPGGILGYSPESEDPAVTECTLLSDGLYQYTNAAPIFEAYHTIGVEWHSNKVFWYIDGNLVSSSFMAEVIPQAPMYVVLAMQLHTGYLDTNIPLPQAYHVDYFRYYQLRDNYCTEDATIISDVQLTNFIFGVRNNITIGTGSSNITVGDNKTFRASNEITILGEFTVPVGKELNLIPTLCN